MFTVMCCSGGPSNGAESAFASFDFDRVYKGPNMGDLLFREMTEPVLAQYLKGFNATVSCQQSYFCLPTSTEHQGERHVTFQLLLRLLCLLLARRILLIKCDICL